MATLPGNFLAIKGFSHLLFLYVNPDSATLVEQMLRQNENVASVAVVSRDGLPVILSGEYPECTILQVEKNDKSSLIVVTAIFTRMMKNLPLT